MATGQVMRWDGEMLNGYEVRTISYEGQFEEDIQDMERLGFTRSMQREGVWVVLRASYVMGEDNSWEYVADHNSLMYAHYNGTDWHVVRVRPWAEQSADSADPIDIWHLPTKDLDPAEKESIALIARDTDMLLDVAASLGDASKKIWGLGRCAEEKGASWH